MSRMTNFILLSFTILQKVDDILSSKGNPKSCQTVIARAARLWRNN
ncbi:unnamed protein product [Pocillopora meandrina]|uniref:Uncharacterized protein n=1 Tax=Pocillopora meandrina TaxID=46732 RepID=A0AAU9W5Y4_9CNID|nr:unnamed protein product [Pocillopora meandrina]